MSNRLLKESDVIEVVTQYISCDYPTEEMAREDAEVLIGRTPSADRPQEWIPCSERLPEKAGHYLCSFKEANRIDNIYVDLACWTGSRWYGYLANEINAWMPLPKPWKGADDE